MKGCKESNCALIGGETSEMSSIYKNGEYDLAGFVVGAVNRNNVLPKLSDITVGDAVIAIASSGIHSNGYSLVRYIIDKKNINIFDKPPFPSEYDTISECLLIPTKIYVKSVLPIMKESKIKAAAHITGGGLIENIPRILPKYYGVEIDMKKWHVHDIFKWLFSIGNVDINEMLRTFNLGIGMILIIDKNDIYHVCNALNMNGETAQYVGNVIKVDGENITNILNVEQLFK